MRWPRYSLSAIAVVIGLFILSILVPMLFIHSGVERFFGQERTFAEFAIANLETWGPVGPVFASQVVRVEKVSDEDDGECAYDPFGVSHQYRAEVELYSWFGIPYGKFVVDCADGSNTGLARY